MPRWPQCVSNPKQPHRGWDLPRSSQKTPHLSLSQLRGTRGSCQALPGLQALSRSIIPSRGCKAPGKALQAQAEPWLVPSPSPDPQDVPITPHHTGAPNLNLSLLLKITQKQKCFRNSAVSPWAQSSPQPWAGTGANESWDIQHTHPELSCSLLLDIYTLHWSNILQQESKKQVLRRTEFL